jgi:type I restriction enzyme, S subunit
MMPEGWYETSLGAVSELITKGTTPTTAGQPYVHTGIPFLRVENVTEMGGLDLSNAKFISEETHKLLARSQVRPNDVLISIAGALGRCCLVPENMPTANMNQAIALIRLDGSALRSLSPLFLRYQLHSPFVQDQIRFVGAQQAQANLNLKQVGELRFLVPPLPEQRKIAAILSSIDEAIEATQAVIDQLQVVKKAMMAELLTRGLPGRHTRFKQTEIGEVPEGWDLCRLEGLIDPATSITYGIVQAGPHVEGGVPYIRTGDVKPWGIALHTLGRTSLEIASAYRRSEVRTGDLVFCIRASVGAVVEVTPDLDGANLTQGTAKISPGNRVIGRFLLWALRSEAVQAWIGNRTKGSTFREITLGSLRVTPIPVPKSEEQQQIALALDAIESRILFEESSREGLQDCKSALSSALLTGEIRVKPDEATP